MQIEVLNLQGNSKERVDLPKVFSEPFRQDLILRAVLASQSNRRQPYGADVMAGKRTSAHYHGYRRHRYTMMNREMARMPRIHGKASPNLTWRPRFVPQAVKGREAHPPKVEKVWEQKINRKEKQKAIRSAIAATAILDLVLKRGHKFDTSRQLPIVLEDAIESVKKTKELIAVMKNLGMQKELERTADKKVRAGRGKMRGRKYKKRVGLLIVIAADKGIGNAAKNIPGANVCMVRNLSTEYLAPGAMAGRLTVWSKTAVEALEKM